MCQFLHIRLVSLTYPYSIYHRQFKAREPEPQTNQLLSGVSRYWGFYFAYSPNKTAEEARGINLSQDVILAIQHLGAEVDTATLSSEAMNHRATLAKHCFYALYLTRIIVLSRFLDCLPRDSKVQFARSAWAAFQRDPPRTAEGDDVFSMVYRHVTKARGSIADLKRTAETRFDSLVYRNQHLFGEEDDPSNPPFYLAIDEVEAPVPQNASSGRRPACSRLGINALFYGFDTP